VFDSTFIKTIYLLLMCVSHFTGSTSNPHESRLRKHLFDPKYQTEDLTTTPVANVEQTVNVSVAMYIVKLIALVKTKSFLHTVF